MYLIVGLGNPGAKYEKTPHNAGFIALDYLAEARNVQFKHSDKFFGEIAELSMAGEKVFLLKPSTFMNLSGKAVTALAHFYKIPADHIIVLSDEAHLPLGKIRIRRGGSAGGHNGLKSIISSIGSSDFYRVRIGIGDERVSDPLDTVLRPLSREGYELIKQGGGKAIIATEGLLSGASLEEVQNEFN